MKALHGTSHEWVVGLCFGNSDALSHRHASGDADAFRARLSVVRPAVHQEGDVDFGVRVYQTHAKLRKKEVCIANMIRYFRRLGPKCAYVLGSAGKGSVQKYSWSSACAAVIRSLGLHVSNLSSKSQVSGPTLL